MSRSINLSTATPAVSQQLDNTGGQLRRLSMRELTGTAGAVVDIYDGTGPNGQLLDTITLNPDESTRDYYRIHEYPYHNGFYIDVISGSVKGAFVVHHSDNWDLEGEPVVIVGSITINANTQ